MKTLRRPRVLGSQTPWEQLCGDGFSRNPRGFVLVLGHDGRLLVAAERWSERFRDWWTWPESKRWREVAPTRGARAAWQQWGRTLKAVLAAETALQHTTTLRRARQDSVHLEWLSQPVRDAAGQRLGVILAGQFDTLAPAAGSNHDGRGDASAGDGATLWIQAKRRRGETGFFVEAFSRGAQTVLGGAPALRVGADFPACLPSDLQPSSLAALAARGGVVEPIRLPTISPDTSVELTLLRGAGARHCILVRNDPARAVRRRMLVACGEQLVALEGELRRAQRLATQGMVAAAIGHEVNNCLGIALANASLFQEQHAGAAAAEAIEPVILALQTGGSICQQFQNLDGKPRQAPDIIDLTPTVRRSFEMLVRVVPRQVTFEAQSAGPLPVRAHATQIEQIVVNLVLNARDATRPGSGVIAIRVGRTEGVAPGAVRHWFEVRDNGVGIAPPDRARLFTAYFTTKPGRRGTGLGLATVLRLTQAVGGEVKLDTEVGQGTGVRIVLPPAEELEATHANHREPSDLRTQRAH